MSRNIEIHADDLRAWAEVTYTVYASEPMRTGVHKRLYVSHVGTYKVTSDREVVYRGADANKAVEMYNSL